MRTIEREHSDGSVDGPDAPLVLVAADPDVAAAMGRDLQAHGYRVAPAHDDVVDACRRLHPAVVLLDTGRETTAGGGVLARLRDEEELAATPVVAVSPGAGVEEVLAGLARGFHDFLRSPVDPAELLARVAAAVRTSRLHETLRRREAELGALSRTDLLTGLASRRHVEEHLRMVAASARRHRQPLSVLIVDVDHLRRLNDRYGHGAGDTVLRAVAQRVLRVLREEDLAGRWGGDKFLVVLPATDLDGSWISGERIRTAANDDPILLAGGQEVVVTVSVGCATGAGDDPEEQVRRADAALRTAKASGRNRVVVDTSEAA